MTLASGLYQLHSVATGYALDGNANHEIYGHEPNTGTYQKWRLIKATP